MTATHSNYPPGGPDWATIAAWDDAGRPDIPNDGTWRSPRCISCRRPIGDDDDAIGTARGPLHSECAIAEHERDLLEETL